MKKKHIRVLERIQNNIPMELIENLTFEQEVAPTVKAMVEKAIKDNNIDKKKRDKFRHLLDAGMLDKKEEVVDKKVESKIEEYFKKEIDKAIKRGELPEKDLNYIKKVKKIDDKRKKSEARAS